MIYIAVQLHAPITALGIVADQLHTYTQTRAKPGTALQTPPSLIH